LAGVSPLFLENSSRVKLGRRLKGLGQGNSAEGHLRVFTHRAMLDLLSLQRLEVVAIHSYRPWPFPIDNLVCRLSHHLAPGHIYQLRLPADGRASASGSESDTALEGEPLRRRLGRESAEDLLDPFGDP